MYSVHSKPGCSWCVKAKDLLAKHNLDFKEYIYSSEEEISKFKEQGFKTFPQIYNEYGYHIGGFTELADHLDNADEF